METSKSLYEYWAEWQRHLQKFGHYHLCHPNWVAMTREQRAAALGTNRRTRKKRKDSSCVRRAKARQRRREAASEGVICVRG